MELDMPTGYWLGLTIATSAGWLAENMRGAVIAAILYQPVFLGVAWLVAGWTP